MMDGLRSGRTIAIALTMAALAAGGTGCGDDEGGGGTASGDAVAQFEVWGEEYIEDEIPAAEFEDGWSVQYSKFLIVIGEVSVADPELGEGGMLGESVLYDLTSPGPHSVGDVTGLADGNYTEVGYRVMPFEAGTVVQASADDADADVMEAGGYSVYVEGTATKGSETYTFSWGFTDPTGYAACVDVGGGQETSGILVPDGGTVDVQLTIHGDHLFYDDLASGDALLRFDHMAAADADMDGDVTLEELDAVDLATIPSGEGTYGVGAGDVNTLGEFVRASTRTLGHFNGEGHCTVVP